MLHSYPIDPIAELETAIRSVFDDPLTPREARQAEAIQQFTVSVGELAAASLALSGLALTGPFAAPLAISATLGFAHAAAKMVVTLAALVDAFGNQTLSEKQMAEVNEALEKAAAPFSSLAVSLENEIGEGRASDAKYRAAGELLEKIMAMEKVMMDKNATPMEKAKAMQEVVEAHQKFQGAPDQDADRGSDRTGEAHSRKTPHPDGGSGPGQHPINKI